MFALLGAGLFAPAFFVTTYYAAASLPVQPAVYLNANVIISGGEGSPLDPYTLSLGN